MEELYQLIEDYLNDVLPEEERSEVERRMAYDEGFRREVVLHAAMQEAFSDARGWQIYANLSEIMQEEAPPDELPPDEKLRSPSVSRSKWWWIVPAVLAALAGIWYFGRPNERIAAPPPVLEPPARPAPPPTQPIATGKDSQPVNKPEDNLFLAKADPADFVPNPTMELYMESKTLGPEDISVRVTTPQNGSVLYPNRMGQTRLHFAGAFAGLPPNEKTAFHLLIFDNKNDNKPLMTIPVLAGADTSGAADFELQSKVAFRLGLYYYQIEEAESGAVLMTGKLFIGKL